MSNAVLAQYTIRSKQEYIFNTNRVLEIVGGSIIIRDAWKVLFKCAEDLGYSVKRLDEEYKHSEIKDLFQNKKLNAVELFCGGGNETVLFDSKESYIKLNKHFSYTLMKNYPGMTLMSVYVDITDDYRDDYARLMKLAELEKKKMYSGQEHFILPFSEVDKETFRPYSMIRNEEGNAKKYSYEAFAKRQKGIEEREKDEAIKFLDYMVTEKGKESLLAVVHADGNNMGSKIMTMFGECHDYDTCVMMMRVFTEDTKKAFVVEGLKALSEKQKELMQKNTKLKEKMEKDKKYNPFAYRVIVKDGDDMTFICNARFVMDYVSAYIKKVQSYESKWKYSSCAGICIFHSHYPFSKAYQMAEQACDDGAKQKVHVVENGKVVAIEEGWVDFHYIHSGIGGNLEEIRKAHNTEKCMARPWLVTEGNETVYTLENFNKLAQIINEHKVSRTNIKNIGILLEDSLEEGRKELSRIYGHKKGLKEELQKVFDNEDDLLKAIYDFAEVYDLWYEEVK